MMGIAYFQYEQLTDDFRPLQDSFELTDYVFEQDSEPERYVWASDTNPNYVDEAKMTELIKRGKVYKTTIRSVNGDPVLLGLGYHVITDSGPNAVSFWMEGKIQPLIWINSNYSYTENHATVKIVLKDYPADYDLKWWFYGGDDISPATTVAEIMERFQHDSEGSDYDSGFKAVNGDRTFRAPVGEGYLIVKTPANTYQVAQVNVGQDEAVTFVAP